MSAIISFALSTKCRTNLACPQISPVFLRVLTTSPWHVLKCRRNTRTAFLHCAIQSSVYPRHHVTIPTAIPVGDHSGFVRFEFCPSAFLCLILVLGSSILYLLPVSSLDSCRVKQHTQNPTTHQISVSHPSRDTLLQAGSSHACVR